MKLVAIALLAIASRAEAKGCHERSDVVGFQHCGHFGTWSPDDPQMPRLWLELGDLTERFVAPTAIFTGNTASEGAAAQAIATGAVLRILGGLDDHVYVGGEASIGTLVETPQVLGAGITSDGTDFISLRAVSGAHVAVRHMLLAVELATGLRYYDIGACIDAKCMSAPDLGHDRFEIDARARVDYFISREFSIGFAIGNGLVDRGDRSAMITIATHFRAMDGN